MRIGFITSYFYPVRGGVEEITFNIARELVKNGHEAHIFCCNRAGNQKLKKYEKISGIHIHRSPSLFRYKYYLDFNPGIIYNAMRYRLDVLHVQSLGFIMSDINVLLKKIFTKTKLFNTPHGPFMALNRYPKWQEFLKKTYETFEYLINRLYHAGIEVNPYQWRWMVKKGFKRNRIFFVPNSLPLSMLLDVDKEPFLKKHNLQKKTILSYVGRIQKYKGLDQVLQALPEILKENKDVVFAVAGKDAGDLERLQALAKKLNIEKSVLFLGEISDEEKLQLLDASEIFILPSEWEAFGIVILEAMARGNVIISTATEGGRFLVDENTGFLYDFGDLKALTQHLKTALNDKKRAGGIKLHNINKASDMTTDEIVQKLEALYQLVQ